MHLETAKLNTVVDGAPLPTVTEGNDLGVLILIDKELTFHKYVSSAVSKANLT